MSIYTKESENIYFLNDKNIATNLNDNTVLSNAVASFDMVSAAYDEFEQICADIILSASNLCIEISNDIKDLSGTVNELYVHKAGDTVDGMLTVKSGISSISDIEVDKNIKIVGNLINGKQSVVTSEHGIALGLSALNTTNYSFTWNGDPLKTDYTSHNSGTFNINPVNDVNGVYVGQKTLSSIIHDDTQLCVTQLSNDTINLSTSLSNCINIHRVSDKAELSNVLSTYANTLCASISGAVDLRRNEDKFELSNILSTYSNNLCSSISTTVSCAGFAKYNNFEFEYDETGKALKLTLKDHVGQSHMLSVDSTSFIKGRIVDHIDIETVGNKKVLRIFWKNAADAEEHVDIELDDLIKIYEAGPGIDIVETTTGWQISAIDYTVLTSILNETSSNVNTLSNTTIPSYVNRLQSVETYVKELSNDHSDGGYIATLCVDLHSLSDHISSDVATLSTTVHTTLSTKVDNVIKHADSLQWYADVLSAQHDGQLPYISANIDALKKEIRGSANFVGQIVLNKYHPDWVIDNDKSLSALIKFKVCEGIERPIKNGNIYEIIFQESTNINPKFTLDNPLYAADQYFDTSDGVRLSHGCFLAIYVSDGVTVSVKLDQINKDNVRVIGGNFYTPYMYHMIQNANTPWLSGYNTTDATYDLSIRTNGVSPEIITKTNHSIGGHNDIAGYNHFLEGENIFEGTNKFSTISVDNDISVSFDNVYDLGDNKSKYTTLSTFELCCELSAAGLSAKLYAIKNAITTALPTTANNGFARALTMNSQLSNVISAVLEIRNALTAINNINLTI